LNDFQIIKREEKEQKNLETIMKIDMKEGLEVKRIFNQSNLTRTMEKRKKKPSRELVKKRYRKNNRF
jgi:hypothetical protein